MKEKIVEQLYEVLDLITGENIEYIEDGVLDGYLIGQWQYGKARGIIETLIALLTEE